jgi:DNA repair exonuclease SbcCD ATPase subunit
MIRIKRVRIRNFLSIGNLVQDIDLTLHGLTLILGENLDISGSTDAGDFRNGVGKTTLIQAICYGLFGKPLTKIKLGNLINNINGKGLYVSVEFEVHGKTYLIERTQKPNSLKFFVDTDGKLNEAKGKNENTQEEIERVISMTHLMFKHVVAMNTFTDPFMRLEARDQRDIIEELLGITQLSQRAEALKKMMDITKDDIKTEESRIKATAEANARIAHAVEQAQAEAKSWDGMQTHLVNGLLAKAEAMTSVDIDVELSVFDEIEEWAKQKSRIDQSVQNANEAATNLKTESNRLAREAQRYEEEAARVDSGEVARLEAQMKRYLTESEQDISAQLNRLTAEAVRRRQEAERKLAQAQRLATDMTALQGQHDNPNGHSCSTCGQGLVGTDHLATIMDRLKGQIDGLMQQIEQAMKDAEKCNEDAAVIEVEIRQNKEAHAARKEEARAKAKTIQQDIEVARTVLEQQKTAAATRVRELRAMIDQIVEQHKSQRKILDDASLELGSLGQRPMSKYANREAVWKIKQERDLLINHLEVEMEKPNPYVSKVEGLQSTLVVIDYDRINDLQLNSKHEVFLYKLLTAKDSFIRKKIVDQNLLFLNKRINHYLDCISLPHEVRFLPDLSVDICLLGRDLDFEQLSGGEKNRVSLATWFSFRDVWESLNDSLNLVFIDEVLDFGMDGAGSEAGLAVLQTMARDSNKNVFLISHKDNLIGRADRVMTVRKEDQFTTIVDDVH